MKNVLLIIGIIILVAALILLALSGINYHMHQNTYDASNEFYHRVYRNYKMFLTSGIIAFVGGLAAVIISRIMH
ncbi:MAG: hypothetical protein K6D02_05970 [Lachnospiraceae bacterium]|nr:hypothetical protein [Lachnospiraceae bacterium]